MRSGRELYQFSHSREEFLPDTSANIPFRMADYRLRVYRRFLQKRMLQVVIYLRPTDSPLAYETAFRLENLECRFNVVRIWEVEPEVFLATPVESTSGESVAGVRDAGEGFTFGAVG